MIPGTLTVDLLAMRSDKEETLSSRSGGVNPADRSHGNDVSGAATAWPIFFVKLKTQKTFVECCSVFLAV